MKPPTKERDDLHFYGNPTQITGMEAGGEREEKDAGPGSIFDEDDVMAQIYHVLGMAEDDDEEAGELPPEEPQMGMGMPGMPPMMPPMAAPGMEEAPPLG